MKCDKCGIDKDRLQAIDDALEELRVLGNHIEKIEKAIFRNLIEA